jgi:hypothetical protein
MGLGSRRKRRLGTRRKWAEVGEEGGRLQKQLDGKEGRAGGCSVPGG